MLQLRDGLQNGVGDLRQGLDLVPGGQGGAEGEGLVQGVVGLQNAGGLGLRLGDGGVIGRLVLEEGHGLALGVDGVAEGAGGHKHRAGQNHAGNAQKGQGGAQGMGGAFFLLLLAEAGGLLF